MGYKKRKSLWYLGLKSKKQKPTDKILGGRERPMSDLRKYIDGRKKIDNEFASGFDEGYDQFKVGAMLRQARESAGLTQEELAQRLKTKKSAISRIENHAEDIKLSTLERIASVLGKKLEIHIA